MAIKGESWSTRLTPYNARREQVEGGWKKGRAVTCGEHFGAVLCPVGPESRALCSPPSCSFCIASASMLAGPKPSRCLAMGAWMPVFEASAPVALPQSLKEGRPHSGVCSSWVPLLFAKTQPVPRGHKTAWESQEAREPMGNGILNMFLTTHPILKGLGSPWRRKHHATDGYGMQSNPSQ